ncbi:unnamed protein product [Pedinophyceae sp. YPF-701]|nr:unnamed protein product [Pedinophyceae sp. YPF-701]
MMEGAARNYDKYDKNKDGLDIDECLALLNGDELKKTLENMGIEHRVRTKEDIEGKFGDADADGNGRLSRTEFMSLYAGLVRERVSADPRLVALALCSALDTNGDGALDGRELRKVLKLVVPMMPVAGWMVPPGARVEYRKVFGDVKDDEK